MTDIISPLPYTFANGAVADATQVDANFAQIVSDVNTNINGSVTSDSNGSTTGIASGVAVQEIGGASLHKTTITLTNVSLALTNDPAVGAYGSAKIYTFPKGLIQAIGGLNKLILSKSSAGVSATWSGHISLGNVPAVTGDLSGIQTEDYWCNQLGSAVSIGPAVAGNISFLETIINDGNIFSPTLPSNVSTTGGTSGAVYLNVAVNAADETVNITPCNIIVNGVLTFIWCNLGDY